MTSTAWRSNPSRSPSRIFSRAFTSNMSMTPLVSSSRGYALWDETELGHGGHEVVVEVVHHDPAVAHLDQLHALERHRSPCRWHVDTVGQPERAGVRARKCPLVGEGVAVFDEALDDVLGVRECDQVAGKPLTDRLYALEQSVVHPLHGVL